MANPHQRQPIQNKEGRPEPATGFISLLPTYFGRHILHSTWQDLSLCQVHNNVSESCWAQWQIPPLTPVLRRSL